MNRRDDLIRFYETLAELERRVGGKRCLADSDGHMDWPQRGVYFFFEPGEVRSDSGEGMRVVRVGTHALKVGSRATFWNRLSQHRGTASTATGNHRGSIFRLLVGAAIKRREGHTEPLSWGVGSDPSQAAQKLGLTRDEILRGEQSLEAEVSSYIRSLPFLWVGVDDAPGPKCDRVVIERNSIALVSNHQNEALDSPSQGWLGSHCDRERVRRSELWNSNHVDEEYDPRFSPLLERYVGKSPSGRSGLDSRR